MIRQLAQCPYCKHCELALDDNPQLVFNPDDMRRPVLAEDGSFHIENDTKSREPKFLSAPG